MMRSGPTLVAGLFAAVLFLFGSEAALAQTGSRVVPGSTDMVALPGSDHPHRIPLRGGASVASPGFDATY